MYLQITKKCNFKCPHCCYSCTMRGKHGNYHTILEAIDFASQHTESISIGGGEPTLHPRFFDILRKCLDKFEYVWMATNGSQTASMYRLANIIDQCDYESFGLEDYCTCETDEEREDCYCEPTGLIYQEDKLSVELSQDCFHDPIDQRITDLWKSRSRRGTGHFGIRNVTLGHNGVAAQGRAKKNRIWLGDHCVCPDIIIQPNGKLKLCGCERSPVIGDIRNGIESKWEDVIYNNDSFRDYECYRLWKKEAA